MLFGAHPTQLTVYSLSSQTTTTRHVMWSRYELQHQVINRNTRVVEHDRMWLTERHELMIKSCNTIDLPIKHVLCPDHHILSDSVYVGW